ncbi:MAG: lipoyl synthase [Actinomycetota bacterium]|nr:lipoyl synthase [Actinomycetota bacterium]
MRANPTGPVTGADRARPARFSLLPGRVLRLRWLGSRVAYRDAHALQRALWAAGREADDWLLLLEHPHVYTAGVRAKAEHMLVDPASVGAELLPVDRGGDITYHGPGQLVGYPVLSVPSGPGATPGYVHELEELVIEALSRVGLPGAGRLPGYPGVWVSTQGTRPRKICAIGARHSRQRTMHGFALNVVPDMSMFGHIVPCGIVGKEVTSLAGEGVHVSVAEVAEAVFELAAERWGTGRPVERQDMAGLAGSGTFASPAASQAVSPAFATVAGTPPATASGDVAPAPSSAAAGAPPVSSSAGVPPAGTRGAQPVRLLARLAAAGVGEGVPLTVRKPPWLRANASLGPGFRSLKKTVRELALVTVCEEAGCPNIFECWADGTATFMINGDRCTRACGFCEVSTAKPLPLDPDEPERVAEAVARLHLAHAVITCVARDDLPDGGASAFAATIRSVRQRCPGTAVEVLVSDLKGDPAALETVFAERPDVFNHNVETVPRLQRAVRPSASYTRSLAVLARAAAAGLTTKSGLMVGLGEEEAEVLGVLADLHAIGVSIVTIGQYLRPTARHLPVARWWEPAELARLAEAGRGFGIREVVASPFTRSSYHARQAAEVVAGKAGTDPERGGASANGQLRRSVTPAEGPADPERGGSSARVTA